jgi:hypothetical protein
VNVLVFVLIVAILALVVAVVAAPLRGRRGEERALEPRSHNLRSAELAAAREAKYQEIRDAELDYRTGKLSREDYERIDAALRAEAIEILDRIEAEEGHAGGQPPSAG